MNKDIKKLLIIVVLYAFSGGIFYNFEELWLQENNMSVNTISTVLSLCALVTVSVIFLSSNFIKQSRLKKFASSLIWIKTFVLILLFCLYQSNLNILIKFLIMVDYAVDTEIFACIYPMIAIINKDDKIYAVRGLLYDISFYIGAILVGLFLGKNISFITISYNSYCLIAAIIMFLAGIVLNTVDIKKYLKNANEDNNNDILLRLLKEIKHDKISIYYLLYNTFGNASYYCLNGILMIILTRELNLSPTLASNIKLITGILAVSIGALILAKLTLKNNYINIGIKYIGRLITYLMAILFFSKTTLVIGLLFTRLTSSAYVHVAAAPYINRYDNNKQLAFSNLKEMTTYFSRAIGTYICGICLISGMKLNFIMAVIFIILCIIFAYMALYLLNKERSVLK